MSKSTLIMVQQLWLSNSNMVSLLQWIQEQLLDLTLVSDLYAYSIPLNSNHFGKKGHYPLTVEELIHCTVPLVAVVKHV